jgi:uncharacterized membrane protein
VALPSLGVAFCLLAAIILAMPYGKRLGVEQRLLAGAAGLGVLIVLWLVLSVDLYHHFDMRRRFDDRTTIDWSRMGQMSLSVLWTFYASALLTVGFRYRVAALRWLAIAFFGLTVVKVFVLDMAGLMALYRIVAFLVLAVVLGIAARVYQRLGRREDAPSAEETISHVG